ncbi:hypothetical protein BVC71_12300 [Marivivens niveibacter]|uniref:Sulfotransferase family protein n=1 Tax=Marivivens niveibacter TaxID=1930667 RepID=A0A251WXA9_9RHOB|nr:sulfotransferase [Marivivens niveibacter]OUD08704.1 hypothetical protein BVC71_12300 [Marivivens niveibacter]
MTGQTLLYCVGATKAGTSWLYRMLHDHDDCHVRAVKEAHYWDTFGPKRCDRQVTAFENRLSALVRQRAQALQNGNQRRVGNLTRQIDDMVGLIDVLKSDRTGDVAYWNWLSQGSADAKVVAEMTPAYSLLDVDLLQRMAALRPMTKMVYLMRDPLDRLWSHIRMDVARESGEADLEANANARLDQIVSGQGGGNILPRGDYRAAVQKLQQVIAPANLLIEFTERMMTSAGWKGICAFLGIQHKDANDERKVHEGAKAKMDEDLAAKAVRFLKDQYDWVAGNVGPLPDRWQANLLRAHA